MGRTLRGNSIRIIFHKIMQSESMRHTKIMGMKKFVTLDMAKPNTKINLTVVKRTTVQSDYKPLYEHVSLINLRHNLLYGVRGNAPQARRSRVRFPTWVIGIFH
jgi:hypothetical protein